MGLLDVELQRIVDEAVDRAIEKRLGSNVEKPIQMYGGLDFALEVLNANGQVITKSTLYNKTHLGQIPCTKVGKRKLWFCRKELETWLKQGMPDISKIEASERIAGVTKR